MTPVLETTRLAPGVAGLFLEGADSSSSLLFAVPVVVGVLGVSGLLGRPRGAGELVVNGVEGGAGSGEKSSADKAEMGGSVAGRPQGLEALGRRAKGASLAPSLATFQTGQSLIHIGWASLHLMQKGPSCIPASGGPSPSTSRNALVW